MESHRQTDRYRPLQTLRVSPGQTLPDQARDSRNHRDRIRDRAGSWLPHSGRAGKGLVGRGAAAVLALVLAAAAAYAGGGFPTARAASYTTVRIDDAPVYRHVLEEDDRLVLVQYSTVEEAEEDEPVHGARGIILQLLVEDAIVAQQTPVISGYGLAAFYWGPDEADDTLPWEASSAQARLSVNPLIDESPASHTIYLSWIDTDDTEETKEKLVEDVKELVASIETNDPDVGLGEYVSPAGITLAGQAIVAAAFSHLVTVAAEAFDFARIPVGEDIAFRDVEIGGLAVPRITEIFEAVLPPADRLLYPDGPGYRTELSIPSTSPPQDCSVNWQCVDDGRTLNVWIEDGAASYLYTGPSSTVGTDAYSLEDITDLPLSMPVAQVILGAVWTDSSDPTDAMITPGVYLNGIATESRTRPFVGVPGVWRGNGFHVRGLGGELQISDVNEIELTIGLSGQGVSLTMAVLSVQFTKNGRGSLVDYVTRLKARHYASDMSDIVVVQRDSESSTDITSECSLGDDRRTLTCAELTRKTYPSDIEVTYYSETEGLDSPFMQSVQASFGAIGIPWAAGRILFVGAIIATMIGFNLSLFKGSTEFLVIAWTGDILFYAARAGALPWAPVLLILFLIVIAGAIGVFKRVTL